MKDRLAWIKRSLWLLEFNEPQADRNRFIDLAHEMCVHFTESLYQTFSIDSPNLVQSDSGDNFKPGCFWWNYNFVGIGRQRDLTCNCGDNRGHAIAIRYIILNHQGRPSFLDLVA